jgi:hypothetical protein
MREEVVVYSYWVDAGCHGDAAATRDGRRTGPQEASEHIIMMYHVISKRSGEENRVESGQSKHQSRPAS